VPLHGAEVDAAGDHRIAMAAAVAALAAEGQTRVRGWEAVATSYPAFLADLESLRP
jgi:3-phosphoshikimate 1-carboxyvinyltransferase